MHPCCSICFERFQSKSQAVAIKFCGHTFDYYCLVHWLINSQTCPVCRTSVSSMADVVSLHFHLQQQEAEIDMEKVETLQQDVNKWNKRRLEKTADLKETLERFSEKKLEIDKTLKNTKELLASIQQRMKKMELSSN